MKLRRFERDEFLAERWRYRAGQHVTILGPTNWGKTTLAYQLLEHAAHPKLPAHVLVMKPRDATVRSFSRAQRYRTVRTWPPVRNPFAAQPSGYTLWPLHKPTLDIDADNHKLYAQFLNVLRDCYRRGNSIVFCDEVAGLAGLPNPRGAPRIDDALIAIWQRGRAMGTGLWSASQRPAYVPLDAYTNAGHMFLGRDMDKRSRDRYSEISGINPKELSTAVLDLAKWEWVYIQVDGPNGRPGMCVVGA